MILMFIFLQFHRRKMNTELITKDNINENIDNHQQQQDDLFSTFDFPVLTDLIKQVKKK